MMARHLPGWVRPRARGRRPGAGAAACGAVLTGLVVLSVHAPQVTRLAGASVQVWLWLAFAAGAWLALRTRPRLALPVIMLGAAATQLAAVSAPPRTSNDLYRYIWDGRVQAAGIDPYRYVPAAPQLARLRDAFLWPAHGPICITATGRTSGLDAGPQLASLGLRVPPITPGCTRINRPGVHTIYPPAAEAYFAVVHWLSAPVSGTLPIQAAAACCAVATAAVLAAGLRGLGRDPRMAVLWAWCPLTILQLGNDAHVDVLAALLTVSALLTLARGGGRARAARGAVLLALAVTTKVTPLLAAPAVLRRRPVTVVTAAVATAVAAYLPHVAAVGGAVIGYLPGYLTEEGYGTGRRFQLLGLAVPGGWAAPAAVVLLGAVAITVLRTADPDRPWRGAVVMTGAALAVTTPELPWYALLLVALVALDGRAEWLAIAAAGDLAPSQAGYAAAVAAVAAVSLARWWARRDTGTGAGLPGRLGTAAAGRGEQDGLPAGGDITVGGRRET
jgi:Glycosyltransferase family 87